MKQVSGIRCQVSGIRFQYIDFKKFMAKSFGWGQSSKLGFAVYTSFINYIFNTGIKFQHYVFNYLIPDT